MPNDFKNAINAYDKSNKSALNDPREIEARALMKSAQNMQAIKESWPEGESDLDNALTKNRQLWTIFVASMEQSPEIPMEVRANIANLGIYTFKRTLDILSDPKPEKLDVLINLNRNIAAGLLESLENSKTNAPQSAPSPAPAQPSSTPYGGNTPSTQSTGQKTGQNTEESRPGVSDLDLDI